MKNSLILGYVPYGTGRVSPFDQVFQGGHQALDPEKPETFDGVHAIVVWGGADISPSIYGEPVSEYTYAGAKPSHRDQYEIDCCTIAIQRGIPIIGICRGAQLLCAMAGGKLVQHVNGHAGADHLIDTYDGQQMFTSSVHHQMLYPWDVEHELLAWSKDRLSNVYIMPDEVGAKRAAECREPEIVYFPKINGLAIQGHPEFMDEFSPFVHYCNDLVEKFLLTETIDD